MTEELKEHFSGLWTGFRKKAMETVAAQEAAYALGKTAAAAVLADDGTVIVEAGHRIDDETIDRAHRYGKLHALAASVIKAGAQDLKEKAQEKYDRSPDGVEARSLGSFDQAMEANRYIGRTAGLDVTDIRGRVIVTAGRKIEYADVDKAREAGVLGALIYSAQQPAPVMPEPEPASSEPKLRPGAVDLTQTYPDTPEPQPQIRRASLPLMTMPEDLADRK
jgi:hypothetical protein